MRNLYLVWLLLLGVLYQQAQGQGQGTFSFDQVRQQLAQKRSAASKLGLGLEKLQRVGLESRFAQQMRIEDGLVKIRAIAQGSPDALRSQLRAHGADRCKIEHGVVCGWFPIDRLAELNAVGDLKVVMAEFKPYRKIGETTSQGDQALRADLARAQAGVDGDGVTVGILSDSYNALGGAEAGVLSGDLPGPGNPNGYLSPVDVLSEINDPNLGIDEGRGMAEIIHDVAPGAEMKFYSAVNGLFDFADGILALREAGCDIIVDDIAYFAEPYFQDGTIAQAASEVVADGAVFFSAAGNNDRWSYEAPYEGLGDIIDDVGELHQFAPGDAFQQFVVPPGGFINLWLQWDDPSILAVAPGEDFYTGPAPEADYDMYLFDAVTGDLVDFSIFDNPNDLLPIELVQYENTTEAPVVLELAIARFSGPSRYLKYIDFGDGLFAAEHNTFSGTSVGHSQAEGGFGIAASFYSNTPEFGDRPAIINFFSSAGGVPILLAPDGSRLADPIVRQQPLVTGPDGGNTTFFPPGGVDIEGDGFPNFFGTSAAAPHIAALAALMLEASGGSLSAMEIGQILMETADDMDDPFTPEFDEGFDLATGFGFVQGDAALASLHEEPIPYRFVLWDANQNAPLTTIRPGDVFAQENLPLRSTIQVLVQGQPGEVLFELEGPVNNQRIEKEAPYTLFSNKGARVDGRFLKQGDYLVSATTASGAMYAVPFTVVGPDPQLAGFSLIDAETDAPIGPLTDGAVIDAGVYPGDLTVQALPMGLDVGSVYLELEGPIEVDRRENSAPYTLFGNDGLDFFGQPFPAGTYTLSATPYARNNRLGAEGPTLSITFTVESTPVVLNLRDERETESGPVPDQRLGVFPNLGPGPFTVRLPELEQDERLQLWLTDASGRTLDFSSRVQDGGDQMILDPRAHQLAPGMYFLHARSGSREFPAVKVNIQP